MDNQDKAERLAQGIANARKVMQKVEGNTSYGSNSNNNGLGNTDPYSEKEPEYISESEMRSRVESKNTGQKNTMRNLSSSKMPKEILESFISNPIVDPTMPVGLDSVIAKVKAAQPELKQVQENVLHTDQQRVVINETSVPAMDTKLIEYIIKKTVEETLEQVSKKSSIDETIQIKIGDKIFGGKLMTLKEHNKK
jgi:hypothetical protein